MSVSGIKSKPVYEPLRADTGGRYHLMLGVGSGATALLRVLGELEATAPALLERSRAFLVKNPVATGQTARAPDASVADASATDLPPPDAAAMLRNIEALAQGGVLLFDDAATLLAEFRSVLEQSLMGTRLYVAGPESFIGLAMRTALEFNLNRDEIRAEECGTLARRVYCVHCRATTEDVRTNIVRCMQCHRWLLVRDHYSRRLAAYMGVMADAEAPGDLPPIKEVYA